MKIYCMACTEHVFNTTELFLSGGEYNGSMFEFASDDNFATSKYPLHAGVVKGDLMCPRCLNGFISHTGGLLTEHGLIPAGQRSYNTKVSIVDDQGRVMTVEPAQEDIEERNARILKLKEEKLSNVAISKLVGVSDVTVGKIIRKAAAAAAA